MPTMLSSIDGSTSLALIVATLSFITVYLHVKKFSFWSSRGVKGPTPWPFLGTNIYYIFKTKVEVENEWSKRYGRTYGVYEGYAPVLKTTDPELIKHIWVKDFANFTERNNKLIFGDHMKRWLFWSQGKHWQNQRAFMTPIFSSGKMKSMYTHMSDCIQRFIREMDTRSSGKQQGKFNKIPCSRDELMSLALDVLATSIFSIKLDTYREKTSEFYKRAFAFAKFDFPWFLVWIFIPSPIARYFQIDLTKYSKYEYFDKLSQTTIDRRRREFDASKNDFIQSLLSAELPDVASRNNQHDDDDDDEQDLRHFNDNSNSKRQLMDQMGDSMKKMTLKKLDDLEIRAQMTFLFLAGFETTSNTLSFCFFELAHNQPVQQQVYEELRELRSRLNDDKTISYTDLMGLKKLDAFVSEIMRIYSTVTEHNRMVVAKKGVVLPTNPPITLPYHTVVAVPTFTLQRDPEYWPNPERFDMTRFYPENRDKIVSGSYMPFGLGPRNCVGMRFALLTIKTTLAKTLLKYHVSPTADSQQYPASKFQRHAFFLQFERTSFALEPRAV